MGKVGSPSVVHVDKIIWQPKTRPFSLTFGRAGQNHDTFSKPASRQANRLPEKQPFVKTLVQNDLF
jgi:hypothetical protein